MSKETLDLMVEGGKASVTPQMGQSLAPMGINIQKIVDKINEKTSSFNGMKVPVKVTVDTESKDSELEIGTPPTSELIKKEVGIEKGSGIPNKNKVGNLALEQVVKIAKMKQDSLLFNDFKSAVKSIAGSCNSAGILVEGKSAVEINHKIDAGTYDDIITNQKTEVSEEKKKQLDQQLKDIQEKIKKELEKEEAERKAAEAAAKEAAEAAEAVTEEKPAEGEEEAKEGEEKPTEEGEEKEAPKEEAKEEKKE